MSSTPIPDDLKWRIEAVLDPLVKAQAAKTHAGINANLCNTRRDHERADAKEDEFREAYETAVAAVADLIRSDSNPRKTA